MNLYIEIRNLRPKNPDFFNVVATDELHEMIAEDLAESVGNSLKLVLELLKNNRDNNVIWNQDNFEIIIRSDDGTDDKNLGSREKITKHIILK